MGRIKTKRVKSFTHDFAEDQIDLFKPEFSENKSVLGEMVAIPSKKLRNIIAGYMTRIVRKRKDTE